MQGIPDIKPTYTQLSDFIIFLVSKILNTKKPLMLAVSCIIVKSNF